MPLVRRHCLREVAAVLSSVTALKDANPALVEVYKEGKAPLRGRRRALRRARLVAGLSV